MSYVLIFCPICLLSVDLHISVFLWASLPDSNKCYLILTTKICSTDIRITETDGKQVSLTR